MDELQGMKAVWEAISYLQPKLPLRDTLLQISFCVWDTQVCLFIGSFLQGGSELILLWCRMGPGETFYFISSFSACSWGECAVVYLLDVGDCLNLGEWDMVSLHKWVETEAWTHMILWGIIKDLPFMWYQTGIHLQALGRSTSSMLELKRANRQEEAQKKRKIWKKKKKFLEGC